MFEIWGSQGHITATLVIFLFAFFLSDVIINTLWKTDVELAKTIIPKKAKINAIFKLKVFTITETKKKKKITFAQSRTDKSPKRVDDLTQVEIIAHHWLDI